MKKQSTEEIARADAEIFKNELELKNKNISPARKKELEGFNEGINKEKGESKAVLEATEINLKALSKPGNTPEAPAGTKGNTSAATTKGNTPEATIKGNGNNIAATTKGNTQATKTPEQVKQQQQRKGLLYKIFPGLSKQLDIYSDKIAELTRDKELLTQRLKTTPDNELVKNELNETTRGLENTKSEVEGFTQKTLELDQAKFEQDLQKAQKPEELMSLKANIQRNLGDFRSEYSKLPSDIIPAEMKTQVDKKNSTNGVTN